MKARPALLCAARWTGRGVVILGLVIVGLVVFGVLPHSGTSGETIWRTGSLLAAVGGFVQVARVGLLVSARGKAGVDAVLAFFSVWLGVADMFVGLEECGDPFLFVVGGLQILACLLLAAVYAGRYREVE